MDFTWAEQFPELLKILTLFELTHLSNPIKYRYKYIPSILQDGPQCGLVALAMCTSENQNETVKLIFEQAKKQNFTFNGEIFSVQYMASLAKAFLKDCKIDVFEGELNTNIIEDFLLDGGLILVPYPFANHFIHINRSVFSLIIPNIDMTLIKTTLQGSIKGIKLTGH